MEKKNEDLPQRLKSVNDDNALHPSYRHTVTRSLLNM